jgi:hypothetical protein
LWCNITTKKWLTCASIAHQVKISDKQNGNLELVVFNTNNSISLIFLLLVIHGEGNQSIMYLLIFMEDHTRNIPALLSICSVVSENKTLKTYDCINGV